MHPLYGYICFFIHPCELDPIVKEILKMKENQKKKIFTRTLTWLSFYLRGLNINISLEFYDQNKIRE